MSRVQFGNVLPTGAAGGKEARSVFSDVTEEKLWKFPFKEAFILLGDQTFSFVSSRVNDKMRSRMKLDLFARRMPLLSVTCFFAELRKLQGRWAGF